MEHNKAKEALSEYLDGALSLSQKEAIERHLETCAECRADLDILKQTLSLVRRMSPIEAPAHFAQQVRKRARKVGFDRKRQGPWTRFMVPYEAALIVLVATVGALIVLQMLLHQTLPTVTTIPPLFLEVKNQEQLSQVAEIAWGEQAQVSNLGRAVAPGTSIEEAQELMVRVPSIRWRSFLEKLKDVGIPEFYPGKEPAESEVFLLVRLRPSR
jgi:predicted anti-sigma-YlaC factor YlaD